jgi:hypothetical protein
MMRGEIKPHVKQTEDFFQHPQIGNTAFNRASKLDCTATHLQQLREKRDHPMVLAFDILGAAFSSLSKSASSLVRMRFGENLCGEWLKELDRV